MPNPWVPQVAASLGGRFQLVITGRSRNGQRVDVTNFRGVPAQLGDYTDADPFGDATFTVTFPQITPLDDLKSPTLHHWLAIGSDVDLWWVKAIPLDTSLYPHEKPVTNPLTGAKDVITPTRVASTSGGVTSYHDGRIKLWEGYIASLEFAQDQDSVSLQIQCQGALFQLDRYRAKPFYPARPWAYESLIADAFDRSHRPALRTNRFRIDWPAGWTRKYPSYRGAPTVSQQLLTPIGKGGTLWTGYASRETGSWNPALTGFIQDLLTVMITDEKSGVREGNQWTLMQLRADPASRGLRARPQLQVRDRYRPADFSLWVGTPGVELQLSGDGTQGENVIYGSGVGMDGSTWNNDVINVRGTRTDYMPLAAGPDVWPEHQLHQNQWVPAGSKLVDFLASMPLEAYTQFGPGFDQTAAISAAKQMYTRDRQVGWTGTITLNSDPGPNLTRWQIHSGMTVLLKGFIGSGAAGVPFHIASVTHSPSQGSVQLTVDTRYRDLLTVEEARSRTRDPLTPIKMLQVGKASVIIEDLQAPWSYSQGSGFIPTRSKDLVAERPANAQFPYVGFLRANPPATHRHYYVQCNANAANPTNRWSGPVPVLVSEKGTIIRTEIICVDVHGNPSPTPFHVSFYYVQAMATHMPYGGLDGKAHYHSAFINDAFEKVDPLTGFHTPGTLQPQQSFIVGWGNQSGGVYRRCGFWPGTDSGSYVPPAGREPSGIFVDDGPWTYDLTTYHSYYGGAPAPNKRQEKNTTIYAEFYAEAPHPVFFIGRLFRQNPGTGS